MMVESHSCEVRNGSFDLRAEGFEGKGLRTGRGMSVRLSTQCGLSRIRGESSVRTPGTVAASPQASLFG
jgi:hypothetical protein